MNSMLKIGAGAASTLASGIAIAQNGQMMNGGGWMGGYGGYWFPILIVVVLVGLVVWVVRQKRK